MPLPDRTVIPLDQLLDPSRRSFCQGAAAGLVILGAASVAGCGDGPTGHQDLGGGDGARPPDLASGADLTAPCGTTGDTKRTPGSFAMNTATYFATDRVFVCRDSGGLYALTSVCTHQGCDVAFATGQFTCPCHGSQYNFQGDVTRGPALNSLKHYPLCLTTGGNVAYNTAATVDATMRYML